MWNWLRAVALILLSSMTLHAPAVDGQPRLALVIGNDAYRSAPLANPVNDARAMARTLETTGFRVILRTNANLREMLAAVREFGDGLKAGSAGLFYFAGHGMQIKGRNFLIPAGADIEREDEAAYQALDAQAVLDKMESAGNGTNLMILDACRNNPFARNLRGAPQGLAQMDAPVGTLVAFSTAPGTVASDGDGGNGLYTQHLLGAILTPGLKVEDVFKQVRAAVRRESGGRQVPWESTSLEGDFYFVPAPPAPVATAAAAEAAASLDDALWDAVKDSAHDVALQLYLTRLPEGRHAAEARARLTAAPPTPAAAPGADPAPELPAADDGRGERAIAESTRRIDEILRWGSDDTDRRPKSPEHNDAGFTQGDRYRWRIVDRMRNESVGMIFWRIDRFDAGGTIWINDGAVQLDREGDLQLANDLRRSTRERWDPPLALMDAARRGLPKDLAGLRELRDHSGQVSRTRFTGSLRPAASEVVALPAGRFEARRFELAAQGDLTRQDGTRGLVTWRQTLWFVKGIGLPVAWELDERIDGRLERRIRQELTAVDVAPEAAP